MYAYASLPLFIRCGNGFVLSQSFFSRQWAGKLYFLFQRRITVKTQLLIYSLVLLFVFGLLSEAYVDFRQGIILDEILFLLMIAGVAYAGVGGSAWQQPLYGAIAGGGLLGLVYVLSKGGMGLGDVKYAGVLGIWTGFPGILVNLYLAFFIGGAVALLLCALHKADLKSRIPFGPCLSAGALLSFFYSVRILDWYRSLFL